jgi:hypothetical protein
MHVPANAVGTYSKLPCVLFITKQVKDLRDPDKSKFIESYTRFQDYFATEQILEITFCGMTVLGSLRAINPNFVGPVSLSRYLFFVHRILVMFARQT